MARISTSQSEFAIDNFNNFKRIFSEIEASWNKIAKVDKALQEKVKKGEMSNEDAIDEWTELVEEDNSLYISLYYVLQPVILHMISSHDSKTVLQILEFFDDKGISPISSKFRNGSASEKSLSSRFTVRGILSQCMFIAAEQNDLELFEFIIEFAEKNKNRDSKRVERKYVPFEYREMFEFDTYELKNISNVDIISLVALINGSKEVYQKCNELEWTKQGNIEAQFDLIISKLQKLEKIIPEVKNILSVEPKYVSWWFDNYPDALPGSDLFIF